MCMCLSVCHVCMDALRNQLYLQAAVTPDVSTGNELGSSGREANYPNH